MEEKRYKLSYTIHYHYKRRVSVINLEFDTFEELIQELHKSSRFVVEDVSKDTGIPMEQIANFLTYVARYDSETSMFFPLASIALGHPEETID